jgi:hypothetical protein
MKKFLAATALLTFATLLVAGSNPKATGDLGWTNPWSHQPVQITFNALATSPTGPDAKGSLVYSDPEITYSMDIKYLKVQGNQAWFAGQVTSTNTTNGCCTLNTWIVYKVQDNGEPGAGVDLIWGESMLTTAPGRAYDMVTQMTDPNAMGAITSGNVQVHK